MARWRSIHSAASSSPFGSSERRCVRPSTIRVTTPVSSSTFRCLEIAGFETPNPRVASPTVAGPTARRSTMPRRIGCERALNGSLTTGLTVPEQRSVRRPPPPMAMAAADPRQLSAGLADPEREERPRVRRVVTLIGACGVAGQRVHVRRVAEHVLVPERTATRVAEARAAARLGVVRVDLEGDDLVLDALEERRGRAALLVDDL